MTYTRLKKIIQQGTFDKNDLMNKIDIFLLANRITEDQYKELINLLNAKE